MLENNGTKPARIFRSSSYLTFGRLFLPVESFRFLEARSMFFVFFVEAMALASPVRSRISEVSLFSALLSILRLFSVKPVAHGKTKTKEEKE